MTMGTGKGFYPVRVAVQFGRTWRRFWFSPASDRLVAWLRIAIGLICLLWLYSFAADVAGWFGPRGILSSQAVRNIQESSYLGSTVGTWRFSLLDLCRTRGQVSAAHVISFGMVAAFTIGFATSFTSIATLIVVSSFIQRAPIVFGITEHLLLSAVLYLCIAPSGRALSVDSFLRRRTKPMVTDANLYSVRSNICLRLIQVHLAMVLFYSGIAKLSGDVWWNGEAVWWMLVQPESTPVDMTQLGTSLAGELLMNVWTYAIVTAELLAATLIWVRIARPAVMMTVIIVYISLIPLTGLVGYCALVIVLLFAFVHHSDRQAQFTCDPQPAVIS